MKRSSPVRPTILIVDDDPGLRHSLHLLLDDTYEVLEAVDGAQAFDALAARKVDLILLDLVMSRAVGFEVLERRNKENKTVPVVVLSGLNTAWTAAAAMRLGAADYVTKPFEEEVLLSAVQEALAAASKPRRIRQIGTPRVVLIGVDLGIHASLTVLLRSQCRVEHSPNLNGAIEYSGLLHADVIIVNWGSLGRDAIEIVRSMGQLFPTAHLVVIGLGRPQGGPSSRPCVIPTASASVSSLLREILAHLSAPAEVPTYSPRIGVALDYVGDHYAVASVRRLGLAVGTAPRYLSTLFRAEIGISLSTYINQIRLEAAKWLLLQTGEKLESIAAQIGLHDASHLSRFFLKHAGGRPGAYRRQLNRSFDKNLWIFKILPITSSFITDATSVFCSASM